MPGLLSAYAERALLNHLFGVATFPPPANIYLGLSLADPRRDGTGLVEPMAASYGRTLANTWEPATISLGRARSYNQASVAFPNAAQPWGLCTHLFAIDSASGVGNMLFSGALSVPISVTSGIVTLPPGDCDLSLSGDLADAVNVGLLGHVLKVAAYSPPAMIYGALSETDPGPAGAAIDEPSAPSYARQLISPWREAISGLVTLSENAAIVDWPVALTDWGRVDWLAFFSAATGGTYLGRSLLARVRFVIPGNWLRAAPGGIDVTAVAA